LSSESEARKSRAKGIILDSQTVSGWTTSVVPIFTYWYLFELDAWPTTAAIGNCAQQIWDWRFGEMYPLDFKKSPSHVQLVSFSFHLESELLTPSQLNQKLCEIRGFLASSALAKSFSLPTKILSSCRRRTSRSFGENVCRNSSPISFLSSANALLTEMV
jgi:hypothetical protein